jgi:hypothetical protein
LNFHGFVPIALIKYAFFSVLHVHIWGFAFLSGHHFL